MFFCFFGGGSTFFKFELQAPDNVGGIFNVAGFLERLKRNFGIVIGAIQTADNNESGICSASAGKNFVKNVIESGFCIFGITRQKLQVVNGDNGRLMEFGADFINVRNEGVNI